MNHRVAVNDIVLRQIEGSGKSTQVELLGKSFNTKIILQIILKNHLKHHIKQSYYQSYKLFFYQYIILMTFIK